MRKPLVDRIPFARLLTIFAIAFGIALGLCGLTVAFNSGTRSPGTDAFGGLGMSLGILELAAMALAVAGIVLTAIAWIILGAVASLSKGSVNSDDES